VDETSIKIQKQWSYRYRAVDPTGARLDFMLRATRDADAAEQFSGGGWTRVSGDHQS
jgi:transposase-like protein